MLPLAVSIFTLSFSIISFAIALRNKNKQALFDRRLTIFMHAEEFKQVIHDNISCLNIPSSIPLDNNMQFRNMINSPFLNGLYTLIPEPLNVDGPGPLDNADAQKMFLLTKAKILKDAETANLIFVSPESTIVSNFIQCFVTVLDGRRRYAIYEKEIRKSEERYRNQHPDEIIDHVDYLNKETDERDRRREYLEFPIHKLKKAYLEYCRYRSSIKRQIRLTSPNILHYEFWQHLLKRR